MRNTISCPRCSYPVTLQARSCEHCGVDLALAAVLAEPAITALKVVAPSELPPGVPLAPEVLVPRIGDYLLERGVLTEAELQTALRHQSERQQQGETLLLGQALLELGLVDRDTLDQAITLQIMGLQNALNNANQRLEQRVQERTEELQAALNRLTELNQLKSNFIANISHELRTPLTHIKGYLDILLEGGLGGLDPSQAEALKVIRKAESRLERLIEDLIQFSLASRGELHLNCAAIDLGALIRANVEQMRAKASANNLSLMWDVPKALPPVWADEEKIGWVLAQLLDNALKFTPAGGRVLVEAWQQDERVGVAVCDTGIGVPQEKLDEIFEPFHQLDGSSTRRYGGAGLGLALTRRILDAHGSQVGVESVEGRGSRFDFSLPAVARKPSGE